MTFADLRRRVIEGLGGEVPYDWDYDYPPPREPDDWSEWGDPIFNVLIPEFEGESTFTTLLNRLPLSNVDVPLNITWLEDELFPRLGPELWGDWGWIG